MGDKISLKIDKREVHGKKVKGLRKQGITPGVVYGAEIDPIAVQANSREVVRAVKAAGMHTPIQLEGAKRRIAMIKDVEYDPTKSDVIRHVAFHAVKADEPVRAEVPIRLTGVGESAAEKAGLIVLQALDRIEVRALPMDLPDALEVSILELTNEGDRVTVGDIKLPAEVEFVERIDEGREEDEDEERPSITDLVIANVYEPAALEAANEAAAGDATDESEVEAEGEEAGADTEAEGEAKSEADADKKAE